MTEHPWPHFANAELACHCGCGRQEMDNGFMTLLESLRTAYGQPMRITSAFRCPEHNVQASTTGTTGPHTTGRAVDVQVAGEDAHHLLALALHLGFSGIGVSQRGPANQRFLHLDTLTQDLGYPRPTIWSY